jgi:hypothetical protein
MLKPWKHVQSHEALFIERYERLLGVARRFPDISPERAFTADSEIPIAMNGFWMEIAGRNGNEIPAKRMQLAANPRSDGSDPYYMSTLMQEAAIPPAPLELIAVGQSDVYPLHTSVRAWSGADNLFSQPQLQNPSNVIAGRFDLAFVTVYLYPLTILGFSYDLLSMERENGTLSYCCRNGLLSALCSLEKFCFAFCWH